MNRAEIKTQFKSRVLGDAVHTINVSTLERYVAENKRRLLCFIYKKLIVSLFKTNLKETRMPDTPSIK